MNNRKFNEMVTKVRVTGGKHWYADRVGETFDVIGIGDIDCGDYFKVDHPRNTNDTKYIIYAEDCEPVEIRYNGKRYRLESRKAEVDEKVVVIANKSGHHFNTGDIVSVTNVWDKGTREEHIDAVNTDGEEWSMGDAEYRVLVPVTESSVSTTQETADNSDKIIEMLTALSTEVAELKREVQTLKGREITVDAPKITIDTSVTVEEVAERIKKALEPLLGRKLTSPSTLTASCDTDGISIKTEVPKPLTRADVVKRAQADVEGLKTHWSDNYLIRRKVDEHTTLHHECYADFIVNREKRTVVYLLRGINTNKARAKGIAKCAPEDVFNADIGKAIALRRALGLTLPSEYTDAPKPEGVAVGDVVSNWEGRRMIAVDGHGKGRPLNSLSVRYIKEQGYKVIDDSYRKEYRKGVRC